MPFSSSTLLHLTVALSFFTPTLLSSASHSHYRRMLHQPFFPLGSLPPTQSPNHSPPAPVTPFPFTASSPPDNPFFPETSIPSPPPPSPDTNTATTYSPIPANVSSLSFPQVPKSSKPASSKLIIGAVAAVIAAIIVVSISAFLHFRRRSSRDSNDTKTHRSDNSSVLHPTSTGNSSNIRTTPKLQRPSQLSSEFLYLGTLVNAHDAIDKPSSYPLPNSCSSNNPAESSTSNPKRTGSPELRPLPPLNRKDFRRNDGNFQLCSCSEDDDDDNQFHSPKRSRRGRDNSIGHFAAVEVGKFSGSCSCSSYSSSSSTSGTPVRSISLSTSPPASLSPERSRLKSPELVNVQLTPQQPLPATDFPSGSFPKSPPNLASPTRANSITSPDQQPSVHPRSVPSPPPPPPPLQPWNKQSEIPRNPTPKDSGLGYASSVLGMPSRPISVQSPTIISPIQVPPLYTKDVEKNESILDSKESPDGNAVKNVHNPRPKLKPLHWDKVRASSDREMVWDQLMSNSFKLNEEMIETLFVMNAPVQSTQRPVLPLPSKENRVLDPKKSQNISILLKALNVSVDEVCEALLEGRAENLGSELLEILLKMTPTKEEERKLKEHKDDSPVKLGPAEKFLKAVLEIPFAFRRMEALLYISSFWYEVEYLKKSLETLEAACEELRNSRIFLKLLEAVLKTGNRMNIGTNRGDASAFKLDTLLKLVDVKGADGKTTLLHFVVQEIMKREGARICTAHQSNCSSDNDDPKWEKLGLQVVSALSSDLMNVKKAAAMDSEALNNDVFKLADGLGNVAEVVRLVEGTRMENSGNPIFSESINGFLIMAEEEIIKIQAQESVALSLVKEITEYFHGNSAKEEAHPLRIFMVVRDFLTILDRVSKEVGLINERTTVSSASKFPIPVNPTLQQPASIGFPPARQLYSSSDDESSSA